LSHAEDYDVVVIGFGTSGAAAALAAAQAGARVLVLEGRNVFARRRRLSSPARRASPRGALRADALAAGVELQTGTTVHELFVDGALVTGVGHSTVDPRTSAGARLWWLNQLRACAPRLPRRLERAANRAAESLLQQASSVGAVRCSAVVLGMDRSHWDFVGPAVWAATSSARRTRDIVSPAAPSRRLTMVPATSGPVPTPELAVRSWCAAQEASDAGARWLGELHVDRISGAVLVGDGDALPGLYAAVPDLLGWHQGDPTRIVAAGRRAGRAAAAVPQPPRGQLRSVV
jgi:hypothetical protein